MNSTNQTYNKLAWLGELPNHWKVVRIANEFKERTEIVSDKYFMPLSVTMQGIVPQLENIAKTDNGDNRKKVCVGDFVINSRSNRKGSGGISMYEGSVSVISNVLKANSNYDIRYTNYLFTNKLFQEEFYFHGKGIVADMWSTKYQDMRNIYIPLPPLTEQIAIANYLDEKCKKISHFIAKKQRFIELLKEQRQNVINEAVTKGINKKVKLIYSDIKWLGSIPEHWEIRRLGSIGKFSKGGNVSKADLLEDGEFAVVLYGDIYTNYEFSIKNVVNRIDSSIVANAVLLSLNDILFTGSGEDKNDIGKCVAFKANEETYAGGDVIIFKQCEFDSEFISYSQNSTLAKYQKHISSKGDIIVHTYASKLKDVKMPFPKSIEEQQQIVQYIKTETATIDKTIAKAEKEIELIKEYKEAMIAEAVMGKINLANSKAESKPAKNIKTTVEFKEAILISKLVKEFGTEKFPMGRFRYTKLSYFFHRYTDNCTQDYLKKVAGPYNPKTKYAGPEKIAIQNKYIVEKNTGTFKGFVPSEKIDQVDNYFSHYWSDDSFKWLVSEFKYTNKEKLELYATIDNAMEELKQKNIEVNLYNIKTLLSNTKDWKAKLERDTFSNENIESAIKYINKLFNN